MDQTFPLVIDGHNVIVHAPDQAAAMQAAQAIQQGIREGRTPPPEVYFQGNAPQLTPDPADIRTQQQEGIQDFWQRGANAGQGLTDIGRGMLTGAADTTFLGFDDEIGGFLRGVLPGGESVREAVDANRAFKAQQDPTAMLAGGLLSAVPLAATAGRYIPAVLAGASPVARGAAAVGTGMAGGAAAGAGAADGRPMLPYMGVGAGIGAGGGLLGPLIGSGVRGAGNLLRRVTGGEGQYLNTRAAGILEGALARDAAAPGGTLAGGVLPSNGPPGQYLRRSADVIEQQGGPGMPIVLADTGGTNTRRTTRAAANVSPNAVLDAELSGRFGEQVPRMQDNLANATGMPRTPDTSGRIAGIEGQARIENRVRYDAAYNAPEAQAVWSPRLQELTRSPAVQTAMAGVNRTAANDAALLGQPAVRDPFAQGANGGFALRPGITPNLQYWDIVQRNLSDAIDNAVGGERRQLIQLRTALLSELDATVPAFRQARAGAAAAFGATDALEAGQIMARDFNMETAEFRRTFNQLSPAEQDLFREGYSNQIMDRLSMQGDNRNVALMGVFNTAKGRERTAIVFGQQVADEIENTVRLENIMNLTKTAAQGNSVTAGGLADLARIFRSPAAAAGAVGTALSVVGGGFNWRTLIPMGLAWGARKGQAAFSEAMADRIGALVASGDPDAIRQAASLLASTPVGNVALRNMEAQLSRSLTAAGVSSGTGALESGGILGFSPLPQ